MKTICVVSGTRADYGLLRFLIGEIKKSKKLKLQLVATGTHLSEKFGSTLNEILDDGLLIDFKVDLGFSSDSQPEILSAMSNGLVGFDSCFERVKPDLLLLLGDRYEILIAAIAAMVKNIPIGHIHGGESTEGAFDESIRHSLTKMSHIHFAANKEYRNRIIQLGEDPKNVFVVGGLGVDAIARTKLLDKAQLQKKMNYKFSKNNLLLTFHPATLDKETAEQQVRELLAAIDNFKNINFIFTMPNADPGSDTITELIRSYVAKNANTFFYQSLGRVGYLSCLKYVDGVVGNSSSGLTEVPTFKKGTINIGDRQSGRMKADSVIDCSVDKASISNAISNLYSQEFQFKLANVVNPYGEIGASIKILKIIENIQYPINLKKKFYDLKCE